MSGRSSRTKGASGERELFALLNEALGRDTFKRNLLQSRIGGADNERSHLVALEVKRHEKLQLNQWMKQCLAQAKPGAVPALAWRASREPWRVAVVMTPAQFASYYRTLSEAT